MQLGTWSDLLTSLFDSNGHAAEEVPGTCLREWLELILHEYDDVDRDHYSDTIGGE